MEGGILYEPLLAINGAGAIGLDTSRLGGAEEKMKIRFFHDHASAGRGAELGPPFAGRFPPPSRRTQAAASDLPSGRHRRPGQQDLGLHRLWGWAAAASIKAWCRYPSPP